MRTKASLEVERRGFGAATRPMGGVALGALFAAILLSVGPDGSGPPASSAATESVAAASWQVSSTSKLTLFGAVRKFKGQTIATGPGDPPKNWKTLANLLLPRASLAFGEYIDFTQNGTAQGVVTAATGQVTLDLPLRLRDSSGATQTFTAYLTTGSTNGVDSDGGPVCDGGSQDPSACRGTPLDASGAFRMVAIVNIPQGGSTRGSGALLFLEISGTMNASCSGVVCAPSDACHLAGTCDPATGVCSNPVAPNGTACSDGNACTRSDSCQSGACVGASPVTCAAADACHLAGICSPTTGVCSNPAAPNGTACNDGNACTRSDSCQSGACVGSNPVTCASPGVCRLAGSCDPATGTCSSPASPNGTACSDGNACTRSDSCQGGACVGSNPVVCSTGGACRLAGSCDPATGACSDPPAADGTACDDGNPCTASDRCASGSCAGTTTDRPPEVGAGVRVARLGDVAQISWPAAANTTAYDVARGLLSALPAGASPAEACVAPSVAGTTATDGSNPPEGDGYWYLVRGSNACAAGPYGFEGGAGEAGTSRTTGACPTSCRVAADCPGTDTACRTRSCTAGECGFVHSAAGVPSSGQTAGDCRRNVCDGSGGVTSVVDDADVSPDGDPCTLDACDGGVPVHPPAAPRTPCSSGGGAVCDGAGACVQCLVPADCPGADTDCRTRTCGAAAPNACGVAFSPSGTPTVSQPVGDCRRSVCDGSGGVGSVVDDTDLPFDANSCTRDLCAAGTPSNPPVASGTACTQGASTGVCDGSGNCAVCGGLMQRCCSGYPFCRPGLACRSGYCR